MNKATTLYVVDQLFNHGNFTVIDEFVKPDLIQHGPAKADGAEGLRQSIASLKTTYPRSRIDIKRVIAEGDRVVLHSNVILSPGTSGLACVNFARLELGKIAEFWEVLQMVPESTVSGNDMFTTLSDPPVTWPDPSADTTLSKKIAGLLFTEAVIGHDLTAFDRYAADPYYDHSAYVANGIAAAKQFFIQARTRYPESTIDFNQVVAEGDLVAVLYHLRRTPDDPGLAAADFVRVRSGRAVEFWDVIQEVPPVSANSNTMF
ncbi:MAG TPA: nuclear transport factor 2 family protein [Kineosporiaceae bacterium]|nr:nuclear transport factor 2 family protein [Kineosporiaceae bacterium]